MQKYKLFVEKKQNRRKSMITSSPKGYRKVVVPLFIPQLELNRICCLRKILQLLEVVVSHFE